MIRKNKAPVIGVDLDNTIIYYDQALYELAVRHGFLANIPPGESLTKQQIRDRVRLESGSDIEWQKLQAELYTYGIMKSEPFPNVMDFFACAKKNDSSIYVISHKTEFASQDQKQTPLRPVALQWLKMNGFFDICNTDLTPEKVYFESSRSSKIGRIKSLQCDMFIDDLAEVLADKTFPLLVEKVLFDPYCLAEKCNYDSLVMHSWKEIRNYIFP